MSVSEEMKFAIVGLYVVCQSQIDIEIASTPIKIHDEICIGVDSSHDPLETASRNVFESPSFGIQRYV